LKYLTCYNWKFKLFLSSEVGQEYVGFSWHMDVIDWNVISQSRDHLDVIEKE